MSKPATILSNLKAQLEADSDLSEYIKEIFLGVRTDITEFPALIIEPIGITEEDELRSRQELHFTVSLMCYSKVDDPEKQIVGSGNVKGILDIENDVKKAISAEPTIGGTVLNTEITETKYDFVDYPIRSFSMSIDFYFRQIATTRT